MDYFIYGAGITELERLVHIVGRISSKKVKRVNKVDFDNVKLLALLCFNHPSYLSLNYGSLLF